MAKSLPMKTCLLWLALIIGGWTQPLHLVFEVQEIRPPEKGKPKVTNYPLEVGLGTRRLYRAANERQTWTDFDTCRVIEQSKGKARECSLYANVGFRWAEARNRWHLGGALSQAGIKDAAAFFDPVQTEHTFSITNPDAKSRPKIEGLRATYLGKVLLDCQGEGLKLSEQQAAAYTRFLRYQFGGHPLALAALNKARLIPQTVKLTFDEKPSRASFFIKLKNSAPSPEPAPPASVNLTPGPGFEALAHRARAVSDQAEHSRLVQQQASEALAKDQVLTAVLLYLGDSLATGDQSGATLRRHRERFQNDPNCAILFTNLSGDDEAASKKLKGLEKAAGAAVHVLRIFEGGVMSARGEIDRAKKLYLEGLLADPYISNAWKDLGDLHFQAFECDQAWKCWDVARHLAPKHKALSQITELEQMLRKEYPEFF